MKLNGVTFKKIKSESDFRSFIEELNIPPRKHIIIKPNWVEAKRGSFTESAVLELLFKSLKQPKTIIESYTFWRHKKWWKEWEDEFSSKEATIETGKKHWDFFKKQDQWFLEWSGIGKLLKKYNVDYINITEEAWSKRRVDAKIIKEIVEKQYGKVSRQELYGYVPQKLFNLRGNVLISFAKTKTANFIYVTLSTKNLFGLVPDPCRCPKYHLEDEKLTGITQSIIDANKIYRSLFNCIFIAEGIFLALEGEWPEEIEPVKNWGMIVGGRNSAEVDAVMAYLMGFDLEKLKPEWFVKIKEVFGGYDKKIVEKIPKELIKKFKNPF